MAQYRSPYNQKNKTGWAIVVGLVLIVAIGVGVQLAKPGWWRINMSTDPMYEYEVPASHIYRFQGVEGPKGQSTVAEEVPTSPTKFPVRSTHHAVILLTDSNSGWLGLAQGLMSIGVPFGITTSVAEAVQHPMVIIYPGLLGKDLSADEFKLLATYTRTAGELGFHPTLSVFNMQSTALYQTFGVTDMAGRKNRFEVRLNASLPITSQFTAPEEQAWRLGDSSVYPQIQTTQCIKLAKNGAKPLLYYGSEDSAAIAYRELDCGTRLLTWGIDLGDYLLRNYSGRGYDGFRKFANAYEPGIDVLLRTLKHLYLESSPDAIAFWPVPDAKALTVNITHDVDFTRSIVNAVKYADWERQAGIKATYFVQTKYIKDWNDDLFLNKDGAQYILQLAERGMEVGSHSVAHSYVYKNFPLGTGQESYPSYQPYVMERYQCFNGTVLGELRVSKFLLEHFSKGPAVVSFRPGHLSNPAALPQAAQATGFKYVSTLTACAMQSYLPQFSRWGRGRNAMLPVVELPIAVEDELEAPMINRLPDALRLAERLGKYGGYLNALIHTDTLHQKLAYEQGLVAALKSKAHFSTLKETGAWYAGWMNLTWEPTEAGIDVYTSTGVDMPKGITLIGPGVSKLQVVQGAVQSSAGGYPALVLPVLPVSLSLPKVALE